MIALVIANVIVAAILVFVYKMLEMFLNWFGDDHLSIPEWMSLLSFPLGLVIPVTHLSIDGMILVGAIYFVNEGIYQSAGISPLGWFFHHTDRLGRKLFRLFFPKQSEQ